MPLVSFVVPVHNAALTLPRCLNSLLAQTEKDWEAICVNDASDDCSREVLQKFAARDARFKILNQADCGPGTARNLGISHAKGEYIAFVDADDWLSPDMIAGTVAAARRYHAELVSFNAWSVSRDKTSKITYYTSAAACGTWKDITQPLFAVRFHSWHFLYRADWLKKQGIKFGFTYICEDVRFVLPAVLSAPKIVFLDEALYFYRQSSASITQKVSRHFAALPIVAAEVSEIVSPYPELKADFEKWKIRHLLWAYEKLPSALKSGFADSLPDVLSEKERAVFNSELSIRQNKKFYLFSVFELWRINRRSDGWSLRILGIIPLLRLHRRPDKIRVYLLGIPLIKIVN